MGHSDCHSKLQGLLHQGGTQRACQRACQKARQPTCRDTGLASQKRRSQLEPRQLRHQHQREERSRRRRKGTGNPTLQRQPCADKTRANSHGPYPSRNWHAQDHETRPAAGIHQTPGTSFRCQTRVRRSEEKENRQRRFAWGQPPTKNPGPWPPQKRQPWLRRGRLQAPRLGHPAKTAELAEVHFRMGRKGKQKLVWISYPASFEDAACPRPGSKCHNKP